MQIVSGIPALLLIMMVLAGVAMGGEGGVKAKKTGEGEGERGVEGEGLKGDGSFETLKKVGRKGGNGTELRETEKKWCEVTGEWRDETYKHSITVENEAEDTGNKEGKGGLRGEKGSRYHVTLATPFMKYFGEGESHQPHHLALTVSNHVSKGALFLLSFTCFGEENPPPVLTCGEECDAPRSVPVEEGK